MGTVICTASHLRSIQLSRTRGTTAGWLAHTTW